MEKKFNRKRKYKNYINIDGERRKVFRKNSFCSKKIIKIIIYFTILSLSILAISKIIFRKKKKILYEKDDINSKIDQLKNLTKNNQTLIEHVEKCIMNNPDEEKCLYQFLCPKEVVGKKRVLFGTKKDGCYVLLDDLENIKIAYSIGIDGIIQFDQALADKGIDDYMYDHTIEKLPYENEKFHWKKIGIGGNSQRSNNIQTLQEMLKENGHLNEKNMIFKMDVEGAEWETLKDTPEDVLLQFKYLAFEYHFGEEYYPFFYDVLKKIYKTHQPFYVHCNPPAALKIYGNNIICRELEVSYIIREGNDFTTDKSEYPIPELSYGDNKYFNPNILKLFDKYSQV
jgi:hypothetical protein